MAARAVGYTSVWISYMLQHTGMTYSVYYYSEVPNNSTGPKSSTARQICEKTIVVQARIIVQVSKSPKLNSNIMGSEMFVGY